MHESTPACSISVAQAAVPGVMVWEICSWHTLGPLIPVDPHYNTWLLWQTESIASWQQHTHFLIASSSRVMRYHKIQIILNWFLRHDTDLIPKKQLQDVMKQRICIINVQSINLPKLYDDITSIWTKISRELFSPPCWIYTFKNLCIFKGKKKAQHCISKGISHKWPVSVWNVHNTSRLQDIVLLLVSFLSKHTLVVLKHGGLLPHCPWIL